MSRNRAYSDLLTDTYDDEVYPRGTLRYELPEDVNASDTSHFLERVWRFVHNDEGAAFAQGDVLEMGDGNGNGTTGTVAGMAVASNTAAQLKQRVLGVANHAIADNKWGWVIAKGYCEIACDGNVSAATKITTDTAGQSTDVVVSDTAATDTQHATIGWATEIDAGAASLVTAIIDVL